ncbi:MAG: acyl transferase [Flavobacterium sp.]|jgi:phenylacetate-coenzyme A ligase PaaK-like adenylate-forming protein
MKPEIEKIFQIQSQKEFNKLTLQVFRFQYDNVKVYQEFCNHLHKNKENVNQIEDIPFLPISFFKTHSVIVKDYKESIIFTSSGTTGAITSRHFVSDISIYQQSFTSGFSQFYGNIENYVILALLPSYLEREGSSLVYMINQLIEKSNNQDSGFYLHNYQELIQKLEKLDQANQNIILFGVTYALLDLLEIQKIKLKNTIIIETGGMKGKRKELIKPELHHILSNGFGVSHIHSEYGMTEMLSQAYSHQNGVFECVPWLKILIRDPENPLEYLSNDRTGGINVIDLANINSCSFIATQDLGKKYNNNTFEVLGRFDNSDIRGCNLLIQ